jgi:DNA-binding MarR family transcriptional regulator
MIAKELNHQTVPADPEEIVTLEPLRSLRTLMLAFETYRNEVARFYGLSVLETQTVSHLMAQGDLGPGDLAVRLGVTPGSVTALLDRLEAERIVERRAHPSDRRRSVISLTRHGRSLVADSSRWFVRAFDDLDAATLPEVAALLDQLAGNLVRQTVVVAAAVEEAQGPLARRAVNAGRSG